MSNRERISDEAMPSLPHIICEMVRLTSYFFLFFLCCSSDKLESRSFNVSSVILSNAFIEDNKL